MEPVDGTRIPVSPRQSVHLASEFDVLLSKPPRQDYVVHTIQNRQANGMPLMHAAIVIAGQETREAYPLADAYPLHFRKTYFAARLQGDTATEYARSQLASKLLGLPPPIGYAAGEFRSCLLIGQPYSRLSPFGLDPEDANLRAARELPLAAAFGLWHLLEDAFIKLLHLHNNGLAHGDTELHNFVVCSSPVELLPIDFEAAQLQSELSPEAWSALREKDQTPLLREAIYLQCALGAQHGALAEASLSAADRLFRAGDRFLRAIDRQAALSS